MSSNVIHYDLSVALPLLIVFIDVNISNVIYIFSAAVHLVSSGQHSGRAVGYFYTSF